MIDYKDPMWNQLILLYKSLINDYVISKTIETQTGFNFGCFERKKFTKLLYIYIDDVAMLAR